MYLFVAPQYLSCNYSTFIGFGISKHSIVLKKRCAINIKCCQPCKDNPNPSSKRPEWLQRFLKRLGYDKNVSAAQVMKTYGVAAILSYGVFDAVTYTISFLLALIGFIRTTGKPLTWKTFPLVFGLMWGINNFSRPFRIVGALLLAPWMDRYIVQPWKKRFTQ